MKITYSTDADAMYIYFQNGEGKAGAVRETVEPEKGILIDVGEDGSLFGIEILDVSARMPLDVVKTVTLDLSETTI